MRLNHNILGNTFSHELQRHVHPMSHKAKLTKLNLVLAVVLLRVTQNPVTQAADVSEGGMSLVGQLLQSQHGPVPTVCERSLQQLEDLDTREGMTIVTTLHLKIEVQMAGWGKHERPL